jgi:hypothetical protein
MLVARPTLSAVSGVRVTEAGGGDAAAKAADQHIKSADDDFCISFAVAAGKYITVERQRYSRSS